MDADAPLAIDGYSPTIVVVGGEWVVLALAIATGLIVAFIASRRRRRAPRSRRILALHVLAAVVLLLGAWWFVDVWSVRVIHFIAAGVSLGFALLILASLFRWVKLIPVHLWHHLTVSFAGTWILGLIIYDEFRVLVRLGILDEHYPWLTALFEIKEHAVLFILFGLMATSLYLLVSRPKYRQGSLMVLWSGGSALVILLASTTGILISGVREV